MAGSRRNFVVASRVVWLLRLPVGSQIGGSRPTSLSLC